MSPAQRGNANEGVERLGKRSAMTEAELLLRVQRLISASTNVEHDRPASMGHVGGAYLLIMRLGVPVPFVRRTIGASLSGWFVYAGSAFGSGGIRARLQRHFRRGKRVHWHVDELTNAAAPVAALAVPGGSECEIVDTLLRSELFEPALLGFGSSDCNRCAAHLLRPLP